MFGALRGRDVARLLTIAQRFTGVSQTRLASAVGLGQSRINEILRGHRTVSSMDVIERVAEGLSMPDTARMLLGLAPTLVRDATTVDDLNAATNVISRAFTPQSAATREIRARVPQAQTIDVIAVRGLGLLGMNDSLLRAALTAPRPHPLTLRVALLNPDGRFAERRAGEIGETQKIFADGVRLSELHLAELATSERLHVEVYRYEMLPTWRVIAVDETLYVGTFDEQWEGHASPMYRLEPGTGGALHRGMLRMCEGIFAQAHRTV
jgi:transcriptional regulator with XRE-family HTH domain